MNDQDQNQGRSPRRKAVLRTAWILVALAVLIYGYIVLSGVINYYS